MNSYKVKGIILAVIISLASIMMPFSVYADGLIVVNGDDYLLGINVDLYDSSLETYVNQAFITSNNGTSNYSQYTQTNVVNQVEVGTYKYTFVFNKSYVGRIVLQYVVPNSQTTRQFTLFVNGTTAEYYSSRDNRYSSTSTFINNWTLSSAQLVEHDDIESLEQIVDLLTDIYSDTTDLVGASSDQLTELQNIVSNTSLANNYLENITKMRQWHFPIESFSFNYYLMQNRQYPIIDIANLNYYDYPVYQVPANGQIEERYINNGQYYVFIIGTDLGINDISNLSTYFDINIGSFSEFELLNVTAGFRFLKFKVINMGSGVFTISVKNQAKIIGILSMRSDYYDKQLFSTDFALNWGLKNRLLENLDIIANGTTQSNSAASDLESEASEYSEIADDVIGVEEGLTSNFETEVNKIDLNTGLNGFGGNFMTSATWVRTQFDRLTENTPYGSLVVYGLTLGFALLMLGKVFL